MEGVKFLQKVRGTARFRDMVMLVIMWCREQQIDWQKMLKEEFGLEKGMEGKNGRVVDEAERLLGPILKNGGNLLDRKT